MSLSIWDYVRRRTCEAALAGFHDALDLLERQDQSQLIHAAAKSLRKRMHELAHNGGNGNGNGSNSDAPAVGAPAPSPPSHGGAKPKPVVPQQHQHHQQNQQQPLPGINGPAPPPANQPPQQHEQRKVGRPRKEVHG